MAGCPGSPRLPGLRMGPVSLDAGPLTLECGSGESLSFFGRVHRSLRSQSLQHQETTSADLHGLKRASPFKASTVIRNVCGLLGSELVSW